MDIQNHFYGHAALLARYSGQPRPRHLGGLLQHGWTALSPLAVNFGDFPDVGARGDRRRLLVWSHASRAWDPEVQDRPSVPIGAPWLYLLQMLPAAVPAAEGDRKPLLVPLHGTHVARLDGDLSAMARYYLDAIGPASVCLHVEDLSHPDVVAAWAVGGNEIVSAGSRFDPLFLPRLLTGMRSATRVVSNRLQTALWYAVAAGVPASVFGPTPMIRGEEAAAIARLRDVWPQIHGEDVRLEAVRDVAAAELGADSVRPPHEIAALCGWSGPGAGRAAADYWVGAPSAKALTVLGLRRRVDSTHAARSSVVAAPKPTDFLKHPFSHLPRPLPRVGWAGRPVSWLRPSP